MASKSARKRRKRRPPPSPPTSGEDGSAEASTHPQDGPGGSAHLKDGPGAPGGPSPSPAAKRRGPTGPTDSPAKRGSPDDRPPAPWGNFPLVELCVLAGLIMLVLGFFFVGGDRGPILIAAGLALGSIGGLDLSIREHFSGYQSHTLLLAGVPAVIVLGALFYIGPDELPPLARAGIAIAIFAVTAYLLSRAFERRSGGLRYRFRPLRGRNR